MKKIAIISAVLLIVPLAALATPVPETEQVQCYDNTQEITCPNSGEPLYGQDAQYTTNPQSYTKLDATGNELPDGATEWVMVRDNVTGLIWEVKTDDDSIHDKDDTYYWQASLNIFIPAINAENFGGFSDWRMPTIHELSSIINMDSSPTINTNYFPNIVSDRYWSSNQYLRIVNSSWYVDFLTGNVGRWGYTEYYYVRAVRGPTSSQNFLDNGDGTVTDTNSGLMWERKTINNYEDTYTWQEALAYCEVLSLAGYDDWRLPDIREIQSLVDYYVRDPSIDTEYFLFTMVGYYWSSTTSKTALDQALSLWFSGGNCIPRDKLESYYVRAVRGGINDSDGDEIPDDGDESGTVGDNPCIGGNTVNCDDNCAYLHNPNQEDIDSDGVGDICDNCINDSNPDQQDYDDDTLGDACDNCTDTDGDGYGNPGFPANTCDEDNCPDIPNGPDLGSCINILTGVVGTTCMNDGECGTGETCSNDQEDRDNNGMGDACDIGTFCKGLADYDQDVDSADVTVFLQHFGRSPFNNPCPLDGPSPVPQTGQDACYDEDGVQRDCEGTGEDGEYQSGVAWPNPRFTDKGNGTIQDNLTGLIWLRDANCIVTNYPEFDNDGTSGNGRVTWQHALDFVKGINDETYPLCGAGYTDWRLPNKKELFSLLRYNCLFVPCIPDTSGTGFWSPGDPFTNVELLYWSSTTYSQNSNTAFFVATDGIIQNNVKINYIGYVWPVRGSH